MLAPSYLITDLLNQQHTSLGKLITQAQTLSTLNEIFSQILEVELSSILISHCRVGCYESGVLTLFTDSAAWATKLRYGVPTLLSKLRTSPQWAGLCSIQI